ncbi:MAG: CRTAC1 family protein [Geminicoccaceae bacterium]
MIRSASLVLTLSIQQALALNVPRFIDEAARAGIEHRYTGGWEFFVGGGVAAFDCDGDQDSDLFFAGGREPAALYRNESLTGGPLAFTHIDDVVTAQTDVLGAYALDIDSDRTTDLVLLRLGENLILRGLGDCRFERANEAFGFAGGQAWSTSFSAVFEQGAALPTLFVGNYIDRHRPGAPFGTCDENALHRPAGERYGEPLAQRPAHCALSALFSDWDRDGVPDLRISNDRQYYRDGREQLVRLPPETGPQAYGPANGFADVKIWGMGIASHDLTGDGLPEVFLTSMADNKLFELADTRRGIELRPAYRDTAFDRGLTLHRPHEGGDFRPSTAWHAEFDDVNNDGRIDLFVAKGNVEGMPAFAENDPNNLVLGRRDGSFTEAAARAGLGNDRRARGAVLTDLNHDGMLDLVVVNREALVEIWRNLGVSAVESDLLNAPMGQWLQLKLRQPGVNPDAIGAWVEVRAGAHLWRREITVGGGHASSDAGWLHFGLGTAERIELRVQWPDGEWGPWQRTFSNRFVRIERGKQQPRQWLPPRTLASKG